MNNVNERKSQPKLYREQLITAGDLYDFKNDLLIEFKKLLKEASGHPGKKWLKSFEVRKLLNLSHNTLANLRINGTLPFTKIGGVIYYDYDDIQAMLTNKKVAS
ncbi:MAG TPA: helix-turn-helix domain-containing protein [Chitinophagaceae bacterium]|nr:helix-turn-helix domain-containing protein [Chitinophagaceae bacterium]